MHQIQQVRSIVQQLAAQERQNAQILANQLAQKERQAAEMLQQCITLCDQMQYQVNAGPQSQSFSPAGQSYGVSTVAQADRGVWNTGVHYATPNTFSQPYSTSPYQGSSIGSAALSNIMQADRAPGQNFAMGYGGQNTYQ